VIQPGTSILGSSWAESGAAYRLDVRDPTMDKRLMEYCLAIPDTQYRSEGINRWLIRRAMAGLLPDMVRLNTRRGLQSADLGFRVLAALPEAQALLTRLEECALAREVLNLDKMKNVLTALQREVNGESTQNCASILMRGLMAGMFLTRFENQS
jgi:asparagine synthase (glutamine-hydrolysing)